MRKQAKLTAALVPVALIGAFALAMPSGAPAEPSANARLGGAIQRALHEGGPFFDAGEREAIERKCGYAPRSWNGFDLRFSNGVLICSNGRRVDDPEIRAIVAAAEPRIARRVDAVMDRPEIVAAIEGIAREAEARALRTVRARDNR